MQGDWNDSVEMKCWHSVELDDAGKRHVIVHLGKVGTPGFLKVRRELSDEHADLVEQLQFARIALARVLREMAAGIEEGTAPLTEADLAHKLLGIRFDEYGTPTTKLPSCWRCEEDEICCRSHPKLRWRTWQCLRCNWTFQHSALEVEAGHG